MPGNYVRQRHVGWEWSLDEWAAYREQILRVKALPEQSEWWNNVGARCLAMADRHIARLASTTLDTESDTAVESPA